MNENLKIYLTALRPHHWSKNILIFLPSLTSGIITIENLKILVLAFFAFSLLASAGYLFNDLKDIETDKKNPYKKDRPIASGKLSTIAAISIFSILLLSSLSIIISLGSLKFAAAGIIYLLLTLSYSIKLKHIIIADIISLSMLYTLRVIAGTVIIASIDMSVWLLSFSALIFLSLATIKRISELKALTNNDNEIKIRGYESNDIIILETLSIVSGYISVVVLVFHFSIEETKILYSQFEMLWLICPIILYWLTRIILITHRGKMHHDPVIFALKDRISISSGVAILIIIMLAKFL
tara:strand:- start:6968 stop:7855 length:888 start_codon:yes stop_codon:yes gene_type:complete